MRRNSNGICPRGTCEERIRGVLVKEMILSETRQTITDQPDRITDLPLPPEVRASPQTTTTSVAQAPLQKAPEDWEGSRVGFLQEATHPDTRRPGEASLPARKFKLRPRLPRRDLSGPGPTCECASRSLRLSPPRSRTPQGDLRVSRENHGQP